MISNGEKGQWHYLAVKKLSALLRGMIFNHHGDISCLNCSYSFTAENKTWIACENKDICNVNMLPDDTKILEFNQYQKYDKAAFIIYADFEYIIEKIDGCKNDPENSSTTKLSEYFTTVFSMCTMSSFRSIENKHAIYRGTDCMKKIARALNEKTNLKKKWTY